VTGYRGGETHGARQGWGESATATSRFLGNFSGVDLEYLQQNSHLNGILEWEGKNRFT
jgi:hypothetical protein